MCRTWANLRVSMREACSDKCVADVRRPDMRGWTTERTTTDIYPFAARARMADEPDALRSLDVCLDSRGPFINVFVPFALSGDGRVAAIVSTRPHVANYAM